MVQERENDKKEKGCEREIGKERLSEREKERDRVGVRERK